MRKIKMARTTLSSYQKSKFLRISLKLKKPMKKIKMNANWWIYKTRQQLLKEVTNSSSSNGSSSARVQKRKLYCRDFVSAWFKRKPGRTMIGWWRKWPRFKIISWFVLRKRLWKILTEFKVEKKVTACAKDCILLRIKWLPENHLKMSLLN